MEDGAVLTWCSLALTAVQSALFLLVTLRWNHRGQLRVRYVVQGLKKTTNLLTGKLYQSSPSDGEL